jgi:hypothetical protein
MNPHTHDRPDLDEVARALAVLLAPGQVTELRALGVTTPAYRRPHTVSGYFNDWAALAGAVARLGLAAGVYVVPNPVDPALLARAYNRCRTVDRDRGRQGLDLDGVDRLARYLGLELVRRRTAER